MAQCCSVRGGCDSTGRADRNPGHRLRRALVRARVSGQLQKVYFKQGAEVREGDPLFRPYEEQVQQARAVLAKDTAAEQQAEAAAARDRSIAENSVKADEANITVARDVVPRASWG